MGAWGLDEMVPCHPYHHLLASLTNYHSLSVPSLEVVYANRSMTSPSRQLLANYSVCCFAQGTRSLPAPLFACYACLLSWS